MGNDRKVIMELTDILDRDIATIVALRMNDERKVSRHQRIIEKISSALGRPLSFYLIILFIVFWVMINSMRWSLFDAPPFP